MECLKIKSIMADPLNSVTGIIKMLQAKSLGPEELAVEISSRIRACDGLYNSFISVTPDLKASGCRNKDSSDIAGVFRPLDAVPFSVKDLFFTDGLPTTCGSRAPVPAGFKDRKQGRAVSRLVEAGAVLAGKNNLHEYAFGITNENDHFGPVLNPWDITRMSGGSSGGSAAAVAAGMVPFALGTDTRGSIRIPSACCGVTGLKPTYNRVSLSGVVPLSSSLDHAGPITRSAEDAEFIFRIIAEQEGGPQGGEYRKERGRRAFRMGICEYYFTPLQQEVAAAVSGAMDVFRKEGVEIREVAIPSLEEALAASDIISRAEGYAFHSENLQAFPEGYGDPVFRRLGTGGDLSAVDLVRALAIRKQVTREFDRVFSEVDCLLAPTLPVTAVPLGTAELEIDGWKEPIVRGFVRFNAPQNMSGLPCLALPCGFDSGGLPAGMQLIADRNREDILFILGRLYQSETDWHLREPGLGAPR